MRINVVCEDGLRLDVFFPKIESVKRSRLNSQIAVNKQQNHTIVSKMSKEGLELEQLMTKSNSIVRRQRKMALGNREAV